jgi:hypothetical protein
MGFDRAARKLARLGGEALDQNPRVTLGESLEMFCEAHRY